MKSSLFEKADTDYPEIDLKSSSKTLIPASGCMSIGIAFLESTSATILATSSTFASTGRTLENGLGMFNTYFYSTKGTGFKGH